MSNDVVIKVENLSKLYRLGELHKQTNSFREKVTTSLRHAFRSFRSVPRAMPSVYPVGPEDRTGAPSALRSSQSDDHLWALRNVSFEVKRGEVLGIIGRNGAGKSTLLKILSRITKPTEGTAWINGRVGSLLEVGTGFHQELTGRENIFLNGAILGMTKAEINRKFDEIVDFAEIEKFIDTPVKRYSSGMYVRLAFAVAAHLEPEILLVDEVLAVGDAAFQKKCLGKMECVAEEGRTVLFVSHNMASISALCSRTILLNEGKIMDDNITWKIIDHYQQKVVQFAETDLSRRQDRTGNGQTRYTGIWIENAKGRNIEFVASGQDVFIVVSYESVAKKTLRNPYVAFALRGPGSERITDLWNEGSGYTWEEIPSSGIIKCKLSKLPLNAGTYTVSLYLRVSGIIEDSVIDAGIITVVSGDFFGTGKLPKSVHGSFLLKQEWLLENI